MNDFYDGDFMDDSNGDFDDDGNNFMGDDSMDDSFDNDFGSEDSLDDDSGIEDEPTDDMCEDDIAMEDAVFIGGTMMGWGYEEGLEERERRRLIKKMNKDAKDNEQDNF